MELTEPELIEKLREGNEVAFEKLFRTHYKPLCTYAWSFLNEKDESEEVVQSVFIRVWDKRNTLFIETSFQAYLYRMVRNACLNVIKHARVKKEHVKHEMAGGETMHEGVTQSLIASELEGRIAEALKKLPEQCRIVFQLSRFEELKYAEIAEQLDISVKTVENHMGKALKLMRVYLKEYLPLFVILMKDWIN